MRFGRKFRLAAALAAVATGGALAAIGPASQAVAFFSPPLFLDVRVESPATLVAKGAAVDVPVEVTCTSGQASLAVSVTERVGGGAVASGFGFTEVGCTRSGEHVVVTVTAVDQAFRKGTAFATATVSGCAEDLSVCGSEDDSATIEIQR